MQIRKIEENEIGLIYNLSLEQFSSESWSYSQFATSYKDINYIYIGAFENNEIASFCVANSSVDDINILLVATKNAYKRKGVAKALIDTLVILSKKENKTLSLEVKTTNEFAINLYKKCNFEVISTRKNYYKDGCDAFVMFYKSK